MDDSCDGCVSQPQEGDDYDWECMNCARWWPDNYVSKDKEAGAQAAAREIEKLNK